jgi:hypothetical protein
VRVIAKLIAAASITVGAFLVLWFFMAVAYLAVDPARRGVTEISLAILFLALGLGMIAVGHRRYPR